MTTARRRLALYAACLVLGAGLLVAGFGITVPPDPGVRLSGARLMAGLGNYDRALAICAQVTEEHPDCVDARVFKAAFLAMAERHDEAIAAYDDALAHLAGQSELRRRVLTDRASVLLAGGRKEEFARARDDLARERMDAGVHILDGLKAREEGNSDAAAEALRRAIAIDPEGQQARALLFSTLMDLGQGAVADGKFAGANRAYDEASALYPTLTEATLKAAEVRLAERDPEGALEVLGGKESSGRGVAPLAFRAATALLAQGRTKEALRGLEAAARADREATRALFDREPAWEPYRNETTTQSLFKNPHPDADGAIDRKGASDR
ncbi:MAG: tetratricopeptide repeat protein [Planctomycetota bacterium]|jgi:tetratricopeptide (TPR) repeat protein